MARITEVQTGQNPRLTPYTTSSKRQSLPITTELTESLILLILKFWKFWFRQTH